MNSSIYRLNEFDSLNDQQKINLINQYVREQLPDTEINTSSTPIDNIRNLLNYLDEIYRDVELSLTSQGIYTDEFLDKPEYVEIITYKNFIAYKLEQLTRESAQRHLNSLKSNNKSAVPPQHPTRQLGGKKYKKIHKTRKNKKHKKN